MAKLILTRYLYIFDEVGLSFIICLLKKHSLYECYFWIAELYLSGFKEQAWNLIWFIYYDFYYILNPLFETFLFKKCGSGELKDIFTVVKNLFKFKLSPEIFITRQYNLLIKDISLVFRGKKPNWLSSIPLHYHALFRFIDKKLYHFAVSSLPETIEDDLFDAIQIYFNISLKQIDDFKKKFVENQTCYHNPVHKIWAIICLLLFNPNYSNSKKIIYFGCKTEDYDTMLKIHQEPIPLNKYNSPQIYKTLDYKCIYSVSPLCSSFYLMRDGEENINHCYWYHWEYFAYESPLWKERFDKYDIFIDDEKKKIIFHDDDELEDFYSQYGYYPDELSSETQNKFLINHIPDDNNWNTLYAELFPDYKSIYHLDEQFYKTFNKDLKFTY